MRGGGGKCVEMGSRTWPEVFQSHLLEKQFDNNGLHLTAGCLSNIDFIIKNNDYKAYNVEK